MAAIRVASQIAEREAPGDILILSAQEDLRLIVAGVTADTKDVVSRGTCAGIPT